MSFDRDVLDKAFLVALPIGETLVLGILLRKQIWRLLPLFTFYIFWGLVSDTGLNYVLNYSPSIYSKYYTAEVIIDSMLMFFVLVEIVWSVLKPVRTSLPRNTIPVVAFLLALVGVVIWPLAARTVPPKMDVDSLLIFHVQETFAIMRVFFFLVLAAFSQLLSIGWRDRELQVATGLGIYAIVTLMIALLHMQQPNAGSDLYHYLDECIPISYLCTLAYWAYSFVTKEQERKEFSPQMQQLLVLMGAGTRNSQIELRDLPRDPTRKKD